MQFMMIGDLPQDIFQHPNIGRLLEQEKAHARNAYMDGVIRQMWLQSPNPGAVAILESDSLDEAQRVASAFPLAQAGLLKVKVIALTPYAGFAET